MDRAVKRALEKEAVKLYGINLKQDCSVTFEDMTLSITYGKVEEPEPEMEPEPSEIVEEITESKPKPKRRGRKKKK